MIDCSHGNSSKESRRQAVVGHDIASQVAGGETAIVGVMMESFLVEGRQDLTAGGTLRYGSRHRTRGMGGTRRLRRAGRAGERRARSAAA